MACLPARPPIVETATTIEGRPSAGGSQTRRPRATPHRLTLHPRAAGYWGRLRTALLGGVRRIFRRYERRPFGWQPATQAPAFEVGALYKSTARKQGSASRSSH